MSEEKVTAMQTRPQTPQEALERLKEGNRRFVNGQSLHGTVSRDVIASLRDNQHPFAIILGCSDSRVPPELVFDQGFGDLFVIRVAGNIIAPGIGGSIQYAYQHLGTSLLVVLGHEGCGAVKAALAARFHQVQHPERIQQLVDLIGPGMEGIDPTQAPVEKLAAGVEANVRWSMHQILRTPEVQRAREEADVLIVGAIYELSSGNVRWLDR